MAASAYDENKSDYLVECFREGFHLRLDRPVHQIVKDRTHNARTIKGNNKTALIDPKAIEDRLEKELKARRIIGPFMGPVSPPYVISPLLL